MLYTFPSKLRLKNYTFLWNHQLYFIPVFIYTCIKVKSDIFSFGCKIIYAPGAIKAEQNTSSTRRNIPTIGTRKYLWIHPRFYSPFWRNKPRHALSLQTRAVGAQKDCFCLFPSVRRESMKKNVKSSIFRKKTSKFLSSLPFKM